MKTDGSNPDKLERRSWLGALTAIKILEARPDVTLPALCHEMAAAHGNRLALAGPDSEISYEGLSDTINRYAGWAAAQASPGETVSLLMPNGPEYAAIWLGISQAGCTTALLNTALAVDALVHCIAAAASNILIFSDQFMPVVEAAMKRLPESMRYWVHGAAAAAPAVRRIDADIDFSPPVSTFRPISSRSVAVLIYTSGTTGLPKAVRLTHSRLVEWSFWFAGMLEISPDDRLYNCLPMYHSTGGIVAIGAMLVHGGTVVIRERFSATRFWDDIVAEKCTIFMYIGELCRYLVQAHAGRPPRQHRLRLCCGNGLSGDVWERFKTQFQIPRIIEFYAATEGSVSLYNCAGRPGAIGHVPAFLAHNFPVLLVKTEPGTSEVLRGEDGLCILSAADEPGEALGKIASHLHLPARHFDGYTDAQASSRKILHGVLTAGDAWFRTGDLLRRDAGGFYYFVERLGETFRWKSENVSTEEVANVIRSCPGVRQAIVFGVAIPGYEGRAGMAEIMIEDIFMFDTFMACVEAALPDYARPVFIRICEALEVTGTFKYKKATSEKVDFLLNSVTQNVWMYDRVLHGIMQLDASLIQKIISGAIKF